MSGTQTQMEELTWPEAAARRTAATLAIIPSGSCEQHGPALALSTDTRRAAEIARRVAERLAPRALVVPALPFGVSEHHMAFAGTVSLSPLTYQQLLYDIIQSLYRHGWRHVFVLNGHGGNAAALAVTLQRLQIDRPDLLVASAGITNVVPDLARRLATSEVTGHACEIETSQVMALDPDLVRRDSLARGSATRAELGGLGALSRSGFDIQFPQPFHRLSRSGALGDATLATTELGTQLVDEAVDRLTRFLNAFIAAAAPASEPEPLIPEGGRDEKVG
jgi:creatinine amidohydrolase